MTHVSRWNSRRPMIAALALLAFCTVFATEAKATCFATPLKKLAAAPKAQFGGHGFGPGSFGDDDKDHSGPRASIVGLWNTVFLLGDTTDVYDQGFQQFHSDGLELMVSNGVPPVMGNVCVGVWKHVGPRMIRLRHMSWNWDPTQDALPLPSAQFAGTFELTVTLRVHQHGNSFSGTWAARNFDGDGNHIPALDAGGVVRGTRINVD